MATALSLMPETWANAMMVVDALMVSAPAYTGDAPVGVEPSVVKRMVAPAATDESVTDCATAYAPPAGENVGGVAWLVGGVTGGVTGGMTGGELVASAWIAANHASPSAG